MQHAYCVFSLRKYFAITCLVGIVLGFLLNKNRRKWISDRWNQKRKSSAPFMYTPPCGVLVGGASFWRGRKGEMGKETRSPKRISHGRSCFLKPSLCPTVVLQGKRFRGACIYTYIYDNPPPSNARNQTRQASGTHANHLLHNRLRGDAVSVDECYIENHQCTHISSSSHARTPNLNNKNTQYLLELLKNRRVRISKIQLFQGTSWSRVNLHKKIRLLKKV